MDDLTDLTCSFLYLFSNNSIQRAGGTFPHESFIADPVYQWKFNSDNPAENYYTGTTPDGILTRIAWTQTSDTYMVHFVGMIPGKNSVISWLDLSRKIQDAIIDPKKIAGLVPWGISLIYSACVSPNSKQTDFSSILTDPRYFNLTPKEVEHCDLTPFGWFWFLNQFEHNSRLGSTGSVPLHSLVLFIPQDRSEIVRSNFLYPLSQGINRIELYLHKAIHHANQYESIRQDLEKARVNLQEQMLTSLHQVELHPIHKEKIALEEISAKLSIFQVQKALSEVTLHSLKLNCQALQDHLSLARLDSTLYNQQKAILLRQADQIESDLKLAQSISESAYTYQDIQHSVESNRLERAGVLLSGAAAVLAGLAIFNNFLDIWNLAIEKSAAVLPSPILRVILGASGCSFYSSWSILGRTTT